MDNKMAKFGRPALGRPGSLADRIAKAQGTQQNAQKPTIMLLLDCSGSMYASENGSHDTKISMLRQAIDAFIKETDLGAYQIGLESFPQGVVHCAPCSSFALLSIAANAAKATGGTPMGATIKYALAVRPRPERCVIVSDGDATDNALGALQSDIPENTNEEFAAVNSAETKIAKRTTPIFDCVHIGDSRNGEDTLKEIARLTGGTYLKFKDMDAFRKGFKFLTPTYRAMLMAGDAAELTGASEGVK
jgi:Mg-chelatase subunit ChlD